MDKVFIFWGREGFNEGIILGEWEKWCKRNNVQHTYKKWRRNDVKAGLLTILAGLIRKGIEIKTLEYLKVLVDKIKQ